MQIEKERIEEILTREYKDKILTEPNPFLINHGIIDMYYPDIADALINDYDTTKELVEAVLNDMTLHDTNLTVRFYNIQNKQLIHDIHSNQQGKLVEINGKVIKTTTVFQQVNKAIYQCQQCGSMSEQTIRHDEKVKNRIQFTCAACNYNRWHELRVDKSEFTDMQLLTVQENRDDTLDGHKPSEIQCILTGDLIQTVKSGDAIILNGLVELRNESGKNMFQEYIIVENIHPEKEDFEHITLTAADKKAILEASKDKDIISKLKSSIAPSIYGCDEIKEAVLLQLFGSDRINVYGSLKRGDIHILLVGDAGLGKSQILKFVSELAPRGIYTSGKSSSGAGLTATATKDVNGVWTLEAGAMVLADKGFLCIDELDKMSETDRSSIHEALEQQTISVSKAGLNTTLDTRCSVLAAANPKFGSFDERNKKLTLAQQINLSDPIQSRFDLIFIMIDSIDNDEVFVRNFFHSNNEVVYDADFIRKYISYAKEEVHPDFTRESEKRIQEFYMKWRRHQYETDTGTKVAPRQMDALTRLSRASARARLSDKVELEDVYRASALVKYCINQFEPQLVDENTEQVGYKEDLSDARTDEKMRDEMKRLAHDYENSIPSKVIYRHLGELQFSSTFIEKWLRDMDDKENMILDVTSQEWSCKGEWYEE
jgi:replicative DNA helicase Mcm